MPRRHKYLRIACWSICINSHGFNGMIKVVIKRLLSLPSLKNLTVLLKPNLCQTVLHLSFPISKSAEKKTTHALSCLS